MRQPVKAFMGRGVGDDYKMAVYLAHPKNLKRANLRDVIPVTVSGKLAAELRGISIMLTCHGGIGLVYNYSYNEELWAEVQGLVGLAELMLPYREEKRN